MKLLTFLITLSFFVISCDTLPFNDRGETKDGVVTTLTMSNSQFDSVEDVTGTFSVTNNLSHTLKLWFPTGCQFGFSVTQGDSTYIDTRNYSICTLATSTMTLKSKETRTFPIGFEFLSEHFEAELEPGTYQLNAFLLGGNGETASADFVLVR